MIIATLTSILISFNIAAEPTVLVAGSTAPALTIDTWVKGDAVTAFDPTKVYVIEFWATWCGPCLVSIPHLTKLQDENPTDLVVIGVAASEKPPKKKDPQPGEPTEPEVTDPAVLQSVMLSKVKGFVVKRDSATETKMGYLVAFDSDGTMSSDWMRAAKAKTIPCAFIVGKDGKIAWIGNPKDMDGPLYKALGKEPPVKAVKKKKTKESLGGAKDATGADPKPPAEKKAIE